MRPKKVLLIGGFLTIGISSIYAYREYNYEKDVDNHVYYSKDHDGFVIAHRGFSSIEIENSVSAIEKGLEIDCSDGIEIDVRISKDNEVVLSHNKFVEGLGKIEESTIEEIQNTTNRLNEISKLKMLKDLIGSVDGKLVFDRYNNLCQKEEEIITLNDVLEYDLDKILIIDLKFEDDTYKELYTKVNEIISNYEGNLDIILQSDNYDYLNEMKELYPNYKYQLIISKKKNLEYIDSDFNAFCIRKNLINKKIVKELKEQNKNISIWTINSYEDYNSLYNKLDNLIKEVNIITDYPDEICYLLNDKKVKKKNK